ETASPGRRQLAGTSGFRVSLPDASVYTELWSLRVISVAGRVHQLKARDETGRRVRFYVALGLVTAATLMLQIIETRIISVTSWYHLAFFVISIAMFGLTAGAVFVYCARSGLDRSGCATTWPWPRWPSP